MFPFILLGPCETYLRIGTNSKAEEFIDLIRLLYKVELESMMLHRTEQDVVTARKQTSIPVLNELI